MSRRFLWLGLALCGCASPLQQLDEASAARDILALSEMLGSESPSYIRERTARRLADMSAMGVRSALFPVLLARLADDAERSYVRAEVALTLSAWRAPEAVPVLLDVLAQNQDRELQYWLVVAVLPFDTPDVRGMVQSLAGDPDLLLSTLVRQWQRTRR